MALALYTPDASKIVHNTGVDFTSRPTTFSAVRLVQYDSKMPIIAVSMYNNGAKFAAPANATANIRWGKHDRKFVQNAAKGWNSDRTVLYFEVTIQMVTEYGKFDPVIELIVGTEVSASSPIHVIVDRNPVQNEDIEDTIEFKTLTDYVEEAKDAATQADGSKTAAAKSASEASASATKAEENAGKTAADKTAVAADKSTVQNLANQVREDKANVQANADKAATSESNSKKWEELSKSYAIGDSDSGRVDEDTENSKFYFEQTRSIANTMTAALKPKGNITFENLIKLAEKAPGDLYNVTNEFDSTADFVDGSGKHYPAGSDVYYTIDNKWNVLQGTGVSGVKGSSETLYRNGLVSISKNDIGLDLVDNTADENKVVKQAGKVGNALTFADNKTYDGSAAVNVDKASVGLDKVENTADKDKVVKQAGQVANALTVGSKTYNGSSTVNVEKSDIVKVLGYEPPINDTQGVNLLAKEYMSSFSINKATEIMNEDEPSDGIVIDRIRHARFIPTDIIDTVGLYINLDEKLFDKIKNRVITISAKIKVNPAEAITFERPFYAESYLSYFNWEKPVALTNNWQTVSATIKLKTNAKSTITLYGIPKSITTQIDYYISELKIELGAVTDPVWTPAPEDLLMQGDVPNANLVEWVDPKHFYDLGSTNTDLDPKNANIEAMTNLIPVIPGEDYTYQLWITTPITVWRYWTNAVWFDSNKRPFRQNRFADTTLTSKIESVYVVKTITAPENAAYLSISFRRYLDYKIKVERGSVPTEWAPGPETVLLNGDVDGRNMIPNTSTPVTLTASSTEKYKFHEFQFTESPLVYGRTYTVSGNIDILSGTFDTVSMFIADDASNEYTHQSAIEDVYVKNGNKFISYLTITGNNAKHLLIYAGTASSTNNNSIRISNLKLELGINPNPKWSPAPEDVMVHSEFEPVLISDFTFTPNGNDTIRYKNVYKYGRLIFLRIGVNLNGNAYSIGRTTYKIDSRYTPLFDISSVITASDNIGSYGNKIATAYISGNTLNVDVFYDNVKDISINCIYIMK